MHDDAGRAVADRRPVAAARAAAGCSPTARSLAADARWRPFVARCARAALRRCRHGAKPAAFTLLERDVRPHPGVPGALRVTASFRNDARWPQPWPHAGAHPVRRRRPPSARAPSRRRVPGRRAHASRTVDADRPRRSAGRAWSRHRASSHSPSTSAEPRAITIVRARRGAALDSASPLAARSRIGAASGVAATARCTGQLLERRRPIAPIPPHVRTARTAARSCRELGPPLPRRPQRQRHREPLRDRTARTRDPAVRRSAASTATATRAAPRRCSASTAPRCARSCASTASTDAPAPWEPVASDRHCAGAAPLLPRHRTARGSSRRKRRSYTVPTGAGYNSRALAAPPP